MAKTIYVVEDDTDIRQLVEYLLVRMGHIVVGCATLELFRKKMGLQFPDLILLDIMLPDGNGETVCRELKGDTLTSHLPILLMSANRFKETYADDFINKPFDIETLLHKVQDLLKTTT